MARKFSSQVSDGMDVFDVNEDKIGTVQEVYDASGAEKSTSGGGYLHVPTGFLGLGTEHHIPFSAIRDVRDGRIHLSVAKDRLDEMGYDARPHSPRISSTVTRSSELRRPLLRPRCPLRTRLDPERVTTGLGSSSYAKKSSSLASGLWRPGRLGFAPRSFPSSGLSRCQSHARRSPPSGTP